MKALDGTPLATLSAANGVTFTMRLVREGQGYGRDLSVIHDKAEPLVEFYDARFKFTGERGAEFGQFVSRYYAETLLLRPGSGLILDGGVPAWAIDGETMRLALAILRNWLSAPVS